LVERIGALSVEQLALSPIRARGGPDLRPIWAIAGHLARARVYWLGAILGEPGADRTPFADNTGTGWEDDLTHPREPSDLIFALESSWTMVEECLGRWTPEMLRDEFRRERDGKIGLHSRQSAADTRRLSRGRDLHTLGMHGLAEVDLGTGRHRSLASYDPRQR
jgi:hypothetical protein